jgi:hypothetical protein
MVRSSPRPAFLAAELTRLLGLTANKNASKSGDKRPPLEDVAGDSSERRKRNQPRRQGTLAYRQFVITADSRRSKCDKSLDPAPARHSNHPDNPCKPRYN